MGTYFAITRAGKKIKSWGQAATIAGHNLRLHDAWNADPDRKDQNVVLVGTSHLEADIRAVIGRAGINLDRVRKDAVLAQEWLYTASPEFFRTGAKNGPWDTEKTALWRDATIKHIEGFFGRHRVASVVLHLDELGSPHIHAVTVPVHQFTPRPRQRKITAVDEPMQFYSAPQKPVKSLSAFNVWGGRARFEAHQNAYADALAHVGLTRGVRGSKRKHKSLKAYYADLADAAEVKRMADELAITTKKAAITLIEATAGIEKEQEERFVELEQILNGVVLLARSLAGPEASQIKTAKDILHVLGSLARVKNEKRAALKSVVSSLVR
jgi:hypothetical protein